MVYPLASVLPNWLCTRGTKHTLILKPRQSETFSPIKWSSAMMYICYYKCAFPTFALNVLHEKKTNCQTRSTQAKPEPPVAKDIGQRTNIIIPIVSPATSIGTSFFISLVYCLFMSVWYFTHFSWNKICRCGFPNLLCWLFQAFKW